MDADEQEDIDRIVNMTAVAVANEIDKMIADLPKGANLVEVTRDLVEQLGTMSKLPEFSDLMKRALWALWAHDKMQGLIEQRDWTDDGPAA